MNDSTTWSPGDSPETPGPTSSTTPAPSWPPTTGNGIGTSPVTRWWSDRQSPEAASPTSTSPSPGGSRSTSSTLHFSLSPHSRAACVFIATPLRLEGFAPGLVDHALVTGEHVLGDRHQLEDGGGRPLGPHLSLRQRLGDVDLAQPVLMGDVGRHVHLDVGLGPGVALVARVHLALDAIDDEAALGVGEVQPHDHADVLELRPQV